MENNFFYPILFNLIPMESYLGSIDVNLEKKKEENNISRYATFISHIYERRRHEGEFFDSSTIGSMTNDP